MTDYHLLDHDQDGPSDTSDNGPITLGLEFGIENGDTGCWLKKIHYWRESSDVQASEAAVWSVMSDSSGSFVAGSNTGLVGDGSTGWQTFELPELVKLDIGQRYRVALLFGGNYPVDRSYWSDGDGAHGLDDGPLYAPNSDDATGDAQGPYDFDGDDALIYPTSGDGTNYGIDVTVTDTYPARISLTGAASARGHAELYDAALAAEVDARNRSPVLTLKADWERDDYDHSLSDLTPVVTTLEIERSLSGDLPDEIGLVEGYASAELTATLAGVWPDDDLPVADAFSPYRADSPLYRRRTMNAPLVCDMGLLTDGGRRLVRQFTGQVRSIKPSSSDREVQLVGADPADQMRKSIDMPLWGMAKSQLSKYGENGHPFFTNTQWVVDYIARRNGIYASPPPHDEAILSVTGHGGFPAEIGFGGQPHNDVGEYDGDVWIDGPEQFGMLAPYSGQEYFVSMEYYCTGPVEPLPGNGFGMAMWVKIGPNMGTYNSDNYPDQVALFCADTNSSDNTVDIQLMWETDVANDSDRRIQLKLGTTNTDADTTQILSNGPAIADAGDNIEWRYVGVHMQFRNNRYIATFRYNGETTTVPHDAWSPWVEQWRKAALVHMRSRRPFTNFQIWNSYNPPDDDNWPGENHESVATIDRGANKLTHLPAVSGKDSWELLQDVVGAEYGTVGFDENGRFFFRSRENKTYGSIDSTKTLTADRSLKDLVVETSVDAIRNAVTLSAAPRLMESESKKMFEADEPDQFKSPPGITDYEIDLPKHTYYFNDYRISQITTDQWDDYQDSGEFDTTPYYVAVEAWGDESTEAENVEVIVTRIGQRKANIRVINNNLFDVQLATADGDAALRLVGNELTEQNPQELKVTSSPSIDSYGERVYEIDDSEWVQWADAFKGVANTLLTQLAYPAPVLDDISAVGDPRVQLDDVVNIQDPDGLGEIRGRVVKINRSMSADDGLHDTYTVRPFGAPGLGILDDKTLGLLDDTMALAP